MNWFEPDRIEFNGISVATVKKFFNTEQTELHYVICTSGYILVDFKTMVLNKYSGLRVGNYEEAGDE
jgi:hypothetical protein